MLALGDERSAYPPAALTARQNVPGSHLIERCWGGPITGLLPRPGIDPRFRCCTARSLLSSSSCSSSSSSISQPVNFGAKLLRLYKGFTYLINGTNIHVSAIMLIFETL